MNWRRHTMMVVASLLVLGGCSLIHPKPFVMDPASPESSAVCVKVGFRPFIPLSTEVPIAVYFAKVDPSKALSKQTEIVQANYIGDAGQCILNAAPGRYVLVSAVASTSQVSGTGYFALPDIEKSSVEIVPGSISFEGRYLISILGFFTGTDEAQEHYRELLDQPLGVLEALSMLSSRPDVTKFAHKAKVVEYARGRDDELAFLREAQKNFTPEAAPGNAPGTPVAASSWVPAIQKRFAELGVNASEPQK